MKLAFSLFCFLLYQLSFEIAFAQTDTIYLSKKGKITTQAKGKTYIVATALDNGHYFGREFDLQGRLRSKGDYASIQDSIQKDGYFVYYDTLGKKSSEGNISKGKASGAWTYYFAGTGKIWYECTYKDGSIVGELRSYYPSGKLKRKEHHSTDRSEPPTGVCYAEDGSEIPYTPFEIMPTPMFDVQKYLARTMRYPKEARKKHIDGKVLIEFVVNEKGGVTEARIIKEAHPVLGDEALRVVRNMPKWNPGLQDGKPVKVFYTLPLTFKLE